MTVSRSIVQPGHPRWDEFREKLRAAERCQQTTEHARAILEAMHGVDAAASLAALDELGGHCDCAILYDLCDDRRHAFA